MTLAPTLRPDFVTQNRAHALAGFLRRIAITDVLVVIWAVLGAELIRFLDELPQLINVLCGQMHLVGPRPPPAIEVQTYGNDVRRRLLVKPGMTGLWQINGRSDLSWKESIRFDLCYVENWSVLSARTSPSCTTRPLMVCLKSSAERQCKQPASMP